MATKRASGRGAVEQNAWNVLRGGPKLPKGLVDGRVAEIKRRLAAARTQTGIGGQMARLWREAQGRPHPLPDDPRSQKGIDGLAALHEKLAKRKLAPPKVPPELGGMLPGVISVKVTPPFDYALTIPTAVQGSPTLAASADDSGQLSVSAVTTLGAPGNVGSAYAEVGIFFHPFSSGTLSVSANPTFSFEWWTNSLGSSPVRSNGDGDLSIYGLQLNPNDPFDFTVVSTAGASFKSWNADMTGQIGLDLGTNLPSAVSTSIAVNRSLIYVVFVSVFAFAEGAGWPGSLAGAVMSATVPSFTWQFQPVLVNESL